MGRSAQAGEEGHLTIKDVAAAAGVCMKTVSNVINTPQIVRPETRARVLKAIEELDYRPSAAARSLVTRRSAMIGLLLFDITNPAYPEIAEVVLDRARRAGFTVLVCNTGRDPAEEERYVDLLIRQHVDGVIITAQRTGSTAAEVLARRGIKVVLLNRHGADPTFPYVGLDNENGGYLATRHLIERGHRRIALVRGVSYSSTSQERERGYRRALAECGDEIAPLVVSGEYAAGATLEAVRALLQRPDRPSAIFAASDLMALSVLDAAAGLGLRVPEDLAVVGFDDIPMAANAAISLTTVGGGLAKLGEMATALLVGLIKGGPEAPTGGALQQILPVTLHVRRSSGGMHEPPIASDAQGA